MRKKSNLHFTNFYHLTHSVLAETDHLGPPDRIAVSYSNAPPLLTDCTALILFIEFYHRTPDNRKMAPEAASAYINNTNPVHTDPSFPLITPLFSDQP